MIMMIRLLAAVFAIFAVANGAVVKQEHSLFPPYPEGEGEVALANWVPIQDARIDENYIRLTHDEPHKSGAIWNYQPVFLNDWEFHVDFQIHGMGASGGNGLALWYSRDAYATGTLYGHQEHFSGLGVFIDTTDQPHHTHMHPYISAVVNNGTLSHSHGAHGTLYQVGGCHMPVRNLRQPAKIAISYIGQILTVFVDLGGDQQGWQICLRSEGVHLPTGYYLGATSSTGDHSDNHDIVSMTTLDMAQQKWEDKSEVFPHAEFIELLPTVNEEHQKEPEEKEAPKVEEQPPKVEAPKETSKAKVVDEKPKPKEKVAKTTEAEPQISQSTSASSTLLMKVLYIAGGSLIIYLAVKVIRSYLARRQERLHKRLF